MGSTAGGRGSDCGGRKAFRPGVLARRVFGYGLGRPIRRGSDCARALPRNGGGRCQVWGLGKPIRPRFALASTGASGWHGRPLKEMPPEDSCGMVGWAWLEGRLCGGVRSVLEILPNFRLRKKRQSGMSFARSRPRFAALLSISVRPARTSFREPNGYGPSGRLRSLPAGNQLPGQSLVPL